MEFFVESGLYCRRIGRHWRMKDEKFPNQSALERDIWEWPTNILVQKKADWTKNLKSGIEWFNCVCVWVLMVSSNWFVCMEKKMDLWIWWLHRIKCWKWVRLIVLALLLWATLKPLTTLQPLFFPSFSSTHFYCFISNFTLPFPISIFDFTSFITIN